MSKVDPVVKQTLLIIDHASPNEFIPQHIDKLELQNNMVRMTGPLS